MPKSIISEGKTSTEAIEKGLKELKVSKNQVDIKIIEEKKKSFFNILDPHIVKVELTLKENVGVSERKEKTADKKEAKEEDIDTARTAIDKFLSDFLKNVSEKITYNIEIKENTIEVTIDGENLQN